MLINDRRCADPNGKDGGCRAADRRNSTFMPERVDIVRHTYWRVRPKVEATARLIVRVNGHSGIAATGDTVHKSAL